MKQNSLTDFINEVIVELQQEGRFATAYIYKYALRAFTQSVGGGEIFWGGLNRGALRRFQTYLEDLQKSYNTISTYIRALRAVYNRAVDRGLVAGEFRLFANLKTGVASEKNGPSQLRRCRNWCIDLEIGSYRRKYAKRRIPFL